MERYFEISSLAEAKDNEEVYALYLDPNKNISGKKTEEKMIKAEQDCKQGKCQLLIWREENSEYLLSSADVEQIKTRYENAKLIAKDYYKKNLLAAYAKEEGRALALEGVLRMIGFDYMEVANGRYLKV